MPQTLIENDRETGTLPVRNLVYGIASALVDDPQSVTVTAISDAHGTTIGLYVAPSDLGKVIGKQGCTARSIRIVLQAASLKLGRKFTLDILGAGASA